MKKLLCMITILVGFGAQIRAQTNTVTNVFYTTHSVYESTDQAKIQEFADRVAHVTKILRDNSPDGRIHRRTYLGDPFYKMQGFIKQGLIEDALTQLDICEMRLKQHHLWYPRSNKRAFWSSNSN